MDSMEACYMMGMWLVSLYFTESQGSTDHSSNVTDLTTGASHP